MADGYVLLDGLTPAGTLKLLADFVQDEANSQPFLRDARVRVEAGASYAPKPQVSLAWSDATLRNGRRENAVWKSFWETYKRQTDRNQYASATTLPDGFRPLAGAGVAELLAHSLDEASDVHPERKRELVSKRTIARPYRREKMLVAADLDSGRSAEIFLQLGVFATQRRTACAETDAGSFYLYHIMDESERQSALEAAVAAGRFPECHFLTAYQSDEVRAGVSKPWLVFVPDTVLPQREALDHFCRFLTAAPDLFTTNAEPKSQALAAVVPGDDENAGTQLLILADILFRDEWEFTRRSADLGVVELLALQESESARAQLQEAIAAAQPRVGYQLELRRSRYRAADADELERLAQKKFEIEEHIADLISFRDTAPRPMLLRFTQEQLPVFADFVRHHPPQELNQLLYGFETNVGQMGGVHFLYVDAQAQRLAAGDPLPWWGQFGQQAMRFWLDPHWARSYWPEAQHHVFVPFGLTLFPTLHSWDVASMDDYLRQMFLEAYEARHRVEQIPDRPLYVFDGLAAPGAQLEMSILDRDAFQPLTSCLEWLNDNLRVLQHVELQTFIAQMADDVARLEMSRQLADEADASMAAFKRKTEKAQQEMAESLRGTFEGIEVEVNEVLQESRAFVSEAQALNHRLQRVRALHAELKALVDQARDHEEQIDEELRQLRQHYEDLVKEVEADIERAGETRERMTRNVEKTVAQLEQTYRELQGKLRELYYIGR